MPSAMSPAHLEDLHLTFCLYMSDVRLTILITRPTPQHVVCHIKPERHCIYARMAATFRYFGRMSTRCTASMVYCQLSLRCVVSYMLHETDERA